MDIKSQRVKESKGQRVKKKPIPTPPYERRAEANRVGERLAARGVAHAPTSESHRVTESVTSVIEF